MIHPIRPRHNQEQSYKQKGCHHEVAFTEGDKFRNIISLRNSFIKLPPLLTTTFIMFSQPPMCCRYRKCPPIVTFFLQRRRRCHPPPSYRQLVCVLSTPATLQVLLIVAFVYHQLWEEGCGHLPIGCKA